MFIFSSIEKVFKTFPKAVLATAAVPLFLLAFAVLARINDEKLSRTVEICVSWDEAAEMAEAEQLATPKGALSFAAVLERLKILGVSSVLLRTQSVADLASEGKLIFFSKEEIEKLKALGLISPGILKPNLLWMKKSELPLEKLLKNIPGTKRLEQKSGDLIAIENEREWRRFKDFQLAADAEQIRLLQSLGLAFVLEPAGDCAVPETNLLSFSGWMQSPAREFKERMVQGFNSDCVGKFIFFENEPLTPWFQSAFLLRPERFVRAHTISRQEMEKQSPKMIRARWLRAVRERSCRFLYFRWNPQLSMEENLALLRSVKEDLKLNGFLLKRLSWENSNAQVWRSYPFRALRLFLTFLLVVLIPCGVFIFLRERVKKSVVLPFWVGSLGARSYFCFVQSLKIWMLAVLLTILGSLLVPVLLPDSVFIKGLDRFRGVKVSLVLPFFILPWILFQRQELVQILRKQLSLWQAASLLLLALSFFLALIRSGNFGLAIFPLEMEFRLTLENFLGVRPRFKEFLLGHPLLLLGIYFLLNETEKKNRMEQRGKGLLLLGAVALVSIVNSFSHLHTPVSISLLRTFHGAWLGAVLGTGLIAIFHLLKWRVGGG